MDSWGKAQDTPSLRELEQLRVLTMYEFDSPLTSQELVKALNVCGNRAEDAYEYLKGSCRHHCSAAIPASVVTAATSCSAEAPEYEREKRRLSASCMDNNDTPSKRHKDQSFTLTDSEEKSEEGEENHDIDAMQDEEVMPIAVDYFRVQQVLLEMVEDRVSTKQPLRNPKWLRELWKCLKVPAVPELAKCLNLTLDALATWVKEVEIRDARNIQTRGAALMVEVAASLSPEVTNIDKTIASSVKEEMLSAKDEEVAAVIQVDSNAADLSAIDRANAAKLAIECLSSACMAYMNQLSQFTLSNETSCKENAQAEAKLEALRQKLIGCVDESADDVNKAERASSEAKEAKETWSLQLLEHVRKRHAELVAVGETEASASLQSVIEVWNDIEVQELWSSRRDSEQRVEKSARALKVAQHTLTFYKSVLTLFENVCEQRAEALSKAFKSLEDTHTRLEARATAALEGMIPILASALRRYYVFRSVQYSKAKKELEEQGKALKAHTDFFGDTAPIKKEDIERRIREFMGLTQSAAQAIVEIAESQQQLWENRQPVLSESVRRVLLREFKALMLQLSGSIQDVVKNIVATMEDVADGDAAVEPKQVVQTPQQKPVSPVFTMANVLDEQVFPVFQVPTFSSSHMEETTPYQTAISAIVLSSPSSPASEKEHDNSIVPMASDSNSSTLTEGNEAMTAPSLSLVANSAPHESRHKFPVGSVLYSKVTVDEKCAQFVRGLVVKQLDNDMYLIQYDNGDKFSVGSSFLFTKDLMEENVRASGIGAANEDTEMEDVEDKASKGNCAIM